MIKNSSFSHTWYRSIFTVLLAIFIISVGVYLSIIEYRNNEWLSRAGCVIVLLGLWSALRGLIQERLLSAKLRTRRRNALIKARATFQEKETSAEKIEKEIHMIEEVFDQKAHELSQQLKMSLGVLEILLLMTGTFLWGFGDLLV